VIPFFAQPPEIRKVIQGPIKQPSEAPVKGVGNNGNRYERPGGRALVSWRRAAAAQCCVRKQIAHMD
jgi:hypothetical protein